VKEQLQKEYEEKLKANLKELEEYKQMVEQNKEEFLEKA